MSIPDVTFLDPEAPTGGDKRSILVFAESLALSTRLYYPGGDPSTNAEYTIAPALGDADRIVLRRGGPDGVVAATLVLAGGVKKALGGKSAGTVEFAGRDQRPLGEWLDLSDKKEAKVEIGGQTYVWVQRPDGTADVGRSMIPRLFGMCADDIRLVYLSS
jgi:hypothetical protein